MSSDLTGTRVKWLVDGCHENRYSGLLSDHSNNAVSVAAHVTYVSDKCRACAESTCQWLFHGRLSLEKVNTKSLKLFLVSVDEDADNLSCLLHQVITSIIREFSGFIEKLLCEGFWS